MIWTYVFRRVGDVCSENTVFVDRRTPFGTFLNLACPLEHFCSQQIPRNDDFDGLIRGCIFSIWLWSGEQFKFKNVTSRVQNLPGTTSGPPRDHPGTTPPQIKETWIWNSHNRVPSTMKRIYMISTFRCRLRRKTPFLPSW